MSLEAEMREFVRREARIVFEEMMREQRVRETPVDGDEELTVKQVARLKNVAPRTIYDWVAQKRIKYHKTPGGQLRFYRRYIDDGSVVKDNV